MASLAALVTPALVLLLAAAAEPLPMPPDAEPPRSRVASAPVDVPRAAARDPSVVEPAEPGTGGLTAPERRLRGAWAWPLASRPSVLRPFIAPTTRWGAGHRGVDLASGLGQPVRAVAAGTVTHVGVIAGRGTVSVLHPSGLRSTYEPLDPSVRLGEVVRQGAVIGTVSAARSHCSPATCLHLGALRGQTYLDPLVLLRGGRVRLLPLH